MVTFLPIAASPHAVAHLLRTSQCRSRRLFVSHRTTQTDPSSFLLPLSSALPPLSAPSLPPSPPSGSRLPVPSISDSTQEAVDPPPSPLICLRRQQQQQQRHRLFSSSAAPVRVVVVPSPSSHRRHRRRHTLVAPPPARPRPRPRPRPLPHQPWVTTTAPPRGMLPRMFFWRICAATSP